MRPLAASSLAAAVAACFAVGLAGADIYPDGHWNYATKIKSKSELDGFVGREVGAGKTVFVRFIASEG
jgi:hypothetical protein